MILMRASSPFSAARRTSRIRSTKPSRNPNGATKSFRNCMRPSESRQMVEEIGHVRGDLGVGGEQSVILVASCGEGVVVAGAEVDIPAELPAFTAHDERRLCVDLEIWKPVDDVDAGLLERARPADVAVLVEACLELDQRHALLSSLRGLDERRHHRRVLARPVERRLERDDRRVARRCLEEGFEARHERVEWVMDEDVAAPDLGEKVVRVRRRREAGMGDRDPGSSFRSGRSSSTSSCRSARSSSPGIR